MQNYDIELVLKPRLIDNNYDNVPFRSTTSNSSKVLGSLFILQRINRIS